MKLYIAKRVIIFANYMIDKKETIRGIARKFKIGKSTVYLDLTQRLPELQKPELLEKIEAILKTNKDERYLRGGLATKYKYKILKIKK